MHKNSMFSHISPPFIGQEPPAPTPIGQWRPSLFMSLFIFPLFFSFLFFSFRFSFLSFPFLSLSPLFFWRRGAGPVLPWIHACGTSCPKSQLNLLSDNKIWKLFIPPGNGQKKDKMWSILLSNIVFLWFFGIHVSFIIPLPMIFAIQVSFIIPLPMMWILLTKLM